MRRVGSIVLIAALLGSPRAAAARTKCRGLGRRSLRQSQRLGRRRRRGPRGTDGRGLQLDRADVDEAVDSVRARPTSSERARRAGPPETESGQEAQEVVTDLRATLSDDVEAVENALSSAPPRSKPSRTSPRRSPRLRTRAGELRAARRAGSRRRARVRAPGRRRLRGASRSAGRRRRLRLRLDGGASSSALTRTIRRSDRARG